MTTIQFTYNKDDETYCFGFWVDKNFVVRACGKKENATKAFYQGMAQYYEE